MAITLRKLTERKEIELLEDLEGKIWDPNDAIPYHMTLTMSKFGGLFLGAFDDDQLIGFLYSFPGFTNGESHLCSHMLGFLPDYRKRGLGVQMKWMQLDEAKAQGFSKITWTYDPLETVNGVLNIVKLGGIVRTFLPDCYGELNDDFNRGLPTDRFLVEWFVDSGRVARHRTRQAVNVNLENAPEVVRYELIDGIPQLTDISLTHDETVLLLPVPAYFQDVKRADFEIARRWREATGQLFTHYLAQGYVVTSITRDEVIVCYVMEKRPLGDILS